MATVAPTGATSAGEARPAPLPPPPPPRPARPVTRRRPPARRRSPPARRRPTARRGATRGAPAGTRAARWAVPGEAARGDGPAHDPGQGEVRGEAGQVQALAEADQPVGDGDDFARRHHQWHCPGRACRILAAGYHDYLHNDRYYYNERYTGGGWAHPLTGLRACALLDAAEELFYARGIAATGVDVVLQRAGVSPPRCTRTSPARRGSSPPTWSAAITGAAAWDEALALTMDPHQRLLSLFEALALFRQSTGATRGCAFLAAAVELPTPGRTPGSMRGGDGSRRTPLYCADDSGPGRRRRGDRSRWPRRGTRRHLRRGPRRLRPPQRRPARHRTTTGSGGTCPTPTGSPVTPKG